MKGKTLLYFFSFMLFTFVVTVSSKQLNKLPPEGNKYLAFATQMPTPVGGISEVYKKIDYPELAIQAGLEGKVYLIAFINTKGNVTDVKVIKKLGAGCDEAAIEAVKNSKFTPGMHKGKPANVKLSLQIQFKFSSN